MKPLILDVETTISSKGNPFDERNKLCYVDSIIAMGILYTILIIAEVQTEIDLTLYKDSLTATMFLLALTLSLTCIG